MKSAMEIAAKDLEKLIGSAKSPMSAIDAHKAETTQYETLTVNIPTDYPTLQAAIDELSKKHTSQGVEIRLNIETGHKLTDGVYVRNGYYGHFRIVSADPIVFLEDNYPAGKEILRCDNGTAPILHCLIDAEGRSGDGVALWYSSSGYITPGYGVINSGARGLYLNSSRARADRTNFQGAKTRPLWVSRGSTVTAEEANFSGNKDTDESGCAAYISRGSVANLTGADLSGSAHRGLIARRSFVNIEGADITGSASEAIFLSNGSLVAAGQALTRPDGFYAADCNIYPNKLDPRGIIFASDVKDAPSRGLVVTENGLQYKIWINPSLFPEIGTLEVGKQVRLRLKFDNIDTVTGSLMFQGDVNPNIESYIWINFSTSIAINSFRTINIETLQAASMESSDVSIEHTGENTEIDIIIRPSNTPHAVRWGLYMELTRHIFGKSDIKVVEAVVEDAPV